MHHKSNEKDVVWGRTLEVLLTEIYGYVPTHSPFTQLSPTTPTLQHPSTLPTSHSTRPYSTTASITVSLIQSDIEGLPNITTTKRPSVWFRMVTKVEYGLGGLWMYNQSIKASPLTYLLSRSNHLDYSTRFYSLRTTEGMSPISQGQKRHMCVCDLSKGGSTVREYSGRHTYLYRRYFLSSDIEDPIGYGHSLRQANRSTQYNSRKEAKKTY